MPVVSWVDARWERWKMGSLSSQSLWCVETTFLRCSPSFSHNAPSWHPTLDVGVLFWFYPGDPGRLASAGIRSFGPGRCALWGPRSGRDSHQSVGYRLWLLIADGVDFRPLGEAFHGDQEVSKKALWYRWRSSRRARRRCTSASGSDFWFWDLGLPSRCRSVDISQRRSSSAANKMAVWPCRVSCWLQGVSLKVLFIFQPTLPSPSCAEWLSEPSWFFRQLTPVALQYAVPYY
jgi:hypothetical protein